MFPGLRANPVVALSYLGNLGVQIFFCISGFCIANAAARSIGSSAACRSYVVARFRRIYPPYLAATIFALVLTFFAEYALSHHIIASSARADIDLRHQGPAFFVATLLLLQVPLHSALLIFPVWSLNYEVAFYAIVLAVLFLTTRLARNGQEFITALHIFTLACIAVAVAIPAAATFPFDLWPQFGIGVLLYDLVANPGSMRPRLFGVAIVTMIVLQIAFRDAPTINPNDQTLLARYSVCLLVAVIVWQTRRFEPLFMNNFVVRILSGIGAFSYSLYLTHEPVTMSVLQLARKSHHMTQANYPIVFTFQIVAALIFAYAFYRLCEAPFLSQRDKAIHRAATAV